VERFVKGMKIAFFKTSFENRRRPIEGMSKRRQVVFLKLVLNRRHPIKGLSGRGDSLLFKTSFENRPIEGMSKRRQVVF
jgi:hypothetical protein